MLREEEDEKVASLLGGLERVEAPAGFERRVMRRIADPAGDAEVRRPVFLLVLKFAAPAAMLLLMGTLFVFFGDREVSTALVPPVQDGQIAPAKLDEPAPANAATASAATPASQTSAANAARPPGSANAASPGPPPEDMAVQGPGERLLPPGIDPRPRNVDPSSAMPRGGVKVTDVLSFLGISSTCGADGCRVTSVSQSSIAGRRNIQTGDLIVSIDGRAVNAATAFAGPTQFRSLRIVRDGRSLDVPIGAN